MGPLRYSSTSPWAGAAIIVLGSRTKLPSHQATAREKLHRHVGENLTQAPMPSFGQGELGIADCGMRISEWLWNTAGGQHSGDASGLAACGHAA